MDIQKGRDFQADIRREIESLRVKLERLQAHDASLELILTDAASELTPVNKYPPSGDGVNAGATPPKTPPNPPLLEGSRPDRIEAILRESGKPMATSEIADRLQKAGDSKEKDVHEFWRIVDAVLRKGKSSRRFTKVGKAEWALESAVKPPVAKTRSAVASDQRSDKNKPTLADSAEAIIRRERHPQSVKQLIDAMSQERGDDLNAHKNIYNSLYSALDRSKSRFRKFSGGKWGLVEMGDDADTEPADTLFGSFPRKEHA